MIKSVMGINEENNPDTVKWDNDDKLQIHETEVNWEDKQKRERIKAKEEHVKAKPSRAKGQAADEAADEAAAASSAGVPPAASRHY